MNCDENQHCAKHLIKPHVTVFDWHLYVQLNHRKLITSIFYILFHLSLLSPLLPFTPQSCPHLRAFLNHVRNHFSPEADVKREQFYAHLSYISRLVLIAR